MLYLVATPIGNLNDITERALQTLREADVIACEDTRHTRKLLTHFNISNSLTSYHAHNETRRADELKEMMLDGKKIAVVSDAGTPAICDPAFELVRIAIENNIKITPIPGAVAFVNALIISGLPTDSHFFGGFLPSKKSERRQRFSEVAQIPATLIFYETPHRLNKSLLDCYETLGNRKAVVVRELTKMYEETVRGDVQSLIKHFTANEPRGEIVLLIARKDLDEPETQISNEKTLATRIAELEAQGIERKTALKQAAKEFGVPRAEAYRQWQAAK
ncbi:MAG: 16S rRNA (cytidine(1402)-2'-O)-methyltransferase [Pyrinomonadaceae bacterium]|nr:16S rRNA (cytidine(1402)-2'-O)-methyltransferase [Pyrinomonadaceae bacterium]